MSYNMKYAMANFIWSLFLSDDMFHYMTTVRQIPFLSTYWTPLFMLFMIWVAYSIYSLVKIYKQDQYFTQYSGFHGVFLLLLAYCSAFEIGRGKIDFLFLLISILLIIPYNLWVRFENQKKEKGSERHRKIYNVMWKLPPIAVLFATSASISNNQPLEIGRTIFTYIYLILTGLFSTIYIADWLEQRKRMIVN